LAIIVAHDLDRGERRSLGAQADVGLGQQKSMARHHFAHVWAPGAVASIVRFDQTLATDVVGDLDCTGIQCIKVFARGHRGQRMDQRGIDPGTTGPGPAACLRSKRERLAQQVGEGVALLGDTFGKGIGIGHGQSIHQFKRFRPARGPKGYRPCGI
jgi:hypothetical protein